MKWNRPLIPLGLIAALAVAGCSRREGAPAPPAGRAAGAETGWTLEWVDAEVPDSIRAGDVADVRVTFRNPAPEPMANTNLSISYHWFRPAAPEPVMVLWDGIRTPVTAPVGASSTYSSSMRVQAPGEPGDYLLVVDLVRDGVSWFQPKGVQPLTRPVKVF